MILKNFLVSLVLISLCLLDFFFLCRNLLFLDDVIAHLRSPFFDSVKAQHLFVLALPDMTLIDVQIILKYIEFVVAERFFFLLENQSFPNFQTTIITKFFNSLGQSLFLLIFMLWYFHESWKTTCSDGSFLKIYFWNDIFKDFTIDIFFTGLSTDDPQYLEMNSVIIGGRK